MYHFQRSEASAVPPSLLMSTARAARARTAASTAAGRRPLQVSPRSRPRLQCAERLVLPDRQGSRAPFTEVS